jgi:hypothetical protein
VDALLRSLLQRAGVGYQVVYGTGEHRLQAALRAMRSAGVLAADVDGATTDGAAAVRAWTWVCEKCSDPACEHRLFSQLRDGKG